MKPSLTLEQQRDYIKRLQVGWEAASANQAEAARNHTDEERWQIAEELQQFAEMFPSPPSPEIDPGGHGLVQQQRIFMKLHRRK